MDKLKIGQIITEPQERDAIHMAVAPVIAGEGLMPGCKVDIVDGVAIEALRGGIGVVDPFLKKLIKRGETFWLFLNPGSITSLRHEWSHPAFVTNDPKPLPTASEHYVRGFADANGFTYNHVLDVVTEAIEKGGAYGGDDDQADAFNDDKHNLIVHVAAIKGIPLPSDMDVYFSCAC